MGRGGTWKTRSRAGEVSMMWEAVREIMDAAGQALEPVAQVGRTRQNHRTILKVGPALKVTVPQPSGTDRVREQAPDAATDPGGTDREVMMVRDFSADAIASSSLPYRSSRPVASLGRKSVVSVPLAGSERCCRMPMRGLRRWGSGQHLRPENAVVRRRALQFCRCLLSVS
ncbi:uncharacterized protein LOC142051361 isoform X1 [Phalacrocorax aristotelis]|uniref:uncharacterized protein LOC142051361 isoform X1 n=1 Tax=Phalacrocorax aristotelis TaxID=126867 RepID=UPI003F4BDB91